MLLEGSGVGIGTQTAGLEATTRSGHKAADSIMQANGHYFQKPDVRKQALPRFSDYDGSGYGESAYDSSHDSMGSERGLGGWKVPQPIPVNGNVTMNGTGGEFDGFDFHQPPMNERFDFDQQAHDRFDFDHDQHLEREQTPQQERQSLGLNTNLRPQQNSDNVGRHLLYETALLDTQHYDILDIRDVDALKKEQGRLDTKIEAAQRKLALESKVRDAAQNLSRLYSTNKRPDTPQSPESPKKNRRGSLRTGKGETLRQADSELTASVKKVDELQDQIRELLIRRSDVESKLLRHTAAVLAEEGHRAAQNTLNGYADHDYSVGHAFSDFDGIRDILHGRAMGSSVGMQHSEDQFTRVQERLEHLNYQLRNIISEAGQTLGRTPAAEVGLDLSENASARLDNRFARLEQNLSTLEVQQREIKAVESQHMQVLQQQEHDLKTFEDGDRQLRGKIEAIEEHLEGVNGQLHNALLQLSNNQLPGIGEPPRAREGEQGYEQQLQYMEEGFLSMETLLESRGGGDSTALKARADDLAKKNSEYESVVTGLWEILQSENSRSSVQSQGGDRDLASPAAKETFSLPAFNSRVQRIFNTAQSARDQQDILRRQIQQQRDLGGKSDMENAAAMAEVQNRHDQLAREHGVLQEELTKTTLKHEEARSEADGVRSELERVTEEVEKLQQLVQKKQAERDDLAREMSIKIQEMEKEVEELNGHHDDAEDKHNEMHKNMQDLEGEVVRLTTELTMAKAELDGAYGTRAERQGTQKAEVEALNKRNKALDDELSAVRAELEMHAASVGHKDKLERELQDLTNEFQELTKESLALERERDQLDSLIDTLRDRCEELEAKMGDERISRAALKSPDGKDQEMRHVLILKQEFKRMMREQRSEGGKVLRAEQEERRRLEAELRKIRQANGPLAKNASTTTSAGSAATAPTPAPAPATDSSGPKVWG